MEFFEMRCASAVVVHVIVAWLEIGSPVTCGVTSILLFPGSIANEATMNLHLGPSQSQIAVQQRSPSPALCTARLLPSTAFSTHSIRAT